MTVLFVLFGMNYIIAMTANAFAEDIQASLNAGMNAHLAKPLDMDEVLKTIARFVRQYGKILTNLRCSRLGTAEIKKNIPLY